jgi:hypothetical protein
MLPTSWLARIDARALANERVTFKRSYAVKLDKLFGPESGIGMGRFSAIRYSAKNIHVAPLKSERREAD